MSKDKQEYEQPDYLEGKKRPWEEGFEKEEAEDAVLEMELEQLRQSLQKRIDTLNANADEMEAVARDLRITQNSLIEENLRLKEVTTAMC